jgi:hypothetical protein
MYLRCTYLQSDLEFGMFILNRLWINTMRQQNRVKSEQSLNKLLFDCGYSEKVAAELWKWYDPSKKGVASF